MKNIFATITAFFRNLFGIRPKVERQLIKRKDWIGFVKSFHIDQIRDKHQKRQAFMQVMAARKMFS